VGAESNCQKIEVQDCDGYEISSDKEFQRISSKKEQPKVIVIYLEENSVGAD
jgi:hypothetical protein